MKLTNLKSQANSIAEGNKTIKNLKVSKKQFLTLSTNNIFTKLRTFKENSNKMVSSIKQNVLNDFLLSYDIKAKLLTRVSLQTRAHLSKTNHCSITEYAVPKQVDFSAYRCCLLEDFMQLKQNAHVFALTPSDHDIHQDNSLESIGIITFNKKSYYVYSFTVHSNAKEKDVTTGITPQDLKHGLNSGN